MVFAGGSNICPEAADQDRCLISSRINTSHEALTQLAVLLRTFWLLHLQVLEGKMAAVVPQVCFGSCKEPNSHSGTRLLRSPMRRRAASLRTVCSQQQVENMLMAVQRCDVERRVPLQTQARATTVVQPVSIGPQAYLGRTGVSTYPLECPRPGAGRPAKPARERKYTN